MDKNFLKRYIEEEKYLQNSPLETREFIEFCKKLSLVTNKKELEFLEKEKLCFPIIRIDRPIGEEERIIVISEKDGKKYMRLAKDGLKKGEKEVERQKFKFYSSYGFDEYKKNLLLNWVEEGNLFDPSTKPFQNWDSFEGERLEYNSKKIVSFYSSFQIYWLYKLKRHYGINFSRSIGEEKQRLQEAYLRFVPILRFLLSIQTIYLPYGRSGSGNIQFRGDVKKWQEIRDKFDSKKELELLQLNIKDIAKWYNTFSEMTLHSFGIRKDDWVQLWKNISWSKKENLEGITRLGVESLQWSLMLKRFIEDHQDTEILDIDEMTNILGEEILKYKPSKMDQYGILLRASRNRDYYDFAEYKNYYYDRYKRLFYLANDFGLDYQPRVMLFVEGETEEQVLPKVFEWRFDRPENLGIEIVNFHGVDKLLSTSENAEKIRKIIIELEKLEKEQKLSRNKKADLNKVIRKLKNTDIIISNWTSFISYNLEKWQIIPFFVSDNEGNIKHFLDAEKPIKFKGLNYNVPKEWKFLWGINNKNQPYKGNNLELANFSDGEIASAISEILNDKIEAKTVKIERDKGSGISKIDKRISKRGNKIKITTKLFENLFEKFKQSKDKSILDRPIFKLIAEIIELNNLNHLPVNRRHEIENKKQIEKWLKGIGDDT